MYWSKSQPIPKEYIDEEHWRVIRDAVIDCEQDFDVRSKKLYAALDYFKQQSTSTWGFTLFYQGLEDWDPNKLREGYRLIRKHLGK